MGHLGFKILKTCRFGETYSDSTRKVNIGNKQIDIANEYNGETVGTIIRDYYGGLDFSDVSETMLDFLALTSLWYCGLFCLNLEDGRINSKKKKHSPSLDSTKSYQILIQTICHHEAICF